jgi:cytochrome c-type biogenesis protein CcmH/NrfG
MTGGLPGAPGLPNAEVQAKITQIESAVLADPKNHNAWVALGNEYFDSHQAQKSVDAYAKALALKPNDPNVLTDQGVMYRQLGQFDKAIANFQKANKLEPNHVQSIFNLGIVYANDLNKPAEAAKAWNQVLATAPGSEQAAQARQMLSQMKK